MNINLPEFQLNQQKIFIDKNIFKILVFLIEYFCNSSVWNGKKKIMNLVQLHEYKTPLPFYFHNKNGGSYEGKPNEKEPTKS